MGVSIYPKFKCSEVYEQIANSTNNLVVLRGSTSSTKTYSALQHIASWIFTGWIRGQVIEKGVARIVRKFSATLDASVLHDFREIIQNTEMWGTDGRQYGHLVDYLKENKSKKLFTFDRREVHFTGADDFNKSKGGRQDIFFANEADALKYSIWEQFNVRTKYLSIIDFNPDDEDIWINQKIEIERAGLKGDVDIIVSTYKQNPFLSEKIRKEIEYWKESDPMMYQVYGLGQYGKIKGLIFEFDEIARLPKGAELIGYGMDFGFSNDPAACVAAYKYNGGIILDEIFYATGMFNSDIDRALREGEVKEDDEIIGDSNEPKSIAELRNYGWDIEAVTKGPDTVSYGISVMQEHKITITARSINLKKELKKYKWKINKNGEQKKKPVKENDHLIDAARYIIMEKVPSKRPKGRKFFMSAV